MFIIGYFLIALAKVLDFALVLLMVLVIARAILSWVSPDPYNPIVRFVHNTTEPLLYRIRAKAPVVFGGFDFSPIIVFLLIIFLREFLVNSISRLGGSLL